MYELKKCQIFTPLEIVKTMLDSIGLTVDIFGTRILENSCGEGNFLVEIVNRYIKDGIQKNISIKTIKSHLENNIVGIEIDETKISICVEKLNSVTNKFGLYDVNWNIIQTDALMCTFENKFDFVVGNPPYIRYSDLDIRTRQFIKKEYSLTCKKGKPDYFYAFLHHAVDNLMEGGKLSYIVPNSILKNKFAKDLRDFLCPYLTSITNFESQKVFNNILVSSVIINCVKSFNVSDDIIYHKVQSQKQTKFKREQLQTEEKWYFEYFPPTNGFIKFGDYFKASYAVATLLNSAFVLKKYDIKEDKLITNSQKVIELDAIRPAASPKGLMQGNEEMIIFPYFYNSKGELLKYDEEVFNKRFPLTVQYLKTFSDELSKRKVETSCNWYEYGRSQAIRNLNKEKLLMSSLITNQVNLTYLTSEYIPYSGIYITSLDKGLSLFDAKKILSGVKFLKYVSMIGHNASGGTLRISARDIENYYFEREEK